MTSLILMRGISGSGKSTAARQHQELYGGVVVSRDDLRMSLYNVAFGPPIDEAFITYVEFKILSEALRRGETVISDNTNLYPEAVIDKFNLAHALGAQIGFVELEVTLAEALENNRQRGIAGGRFVSEDVITKQEHAFFDHQESVREIYQCYLSYGLM